MRMTKALTGQLMVVSPHPTKDDECETLIYNSGGFPLLLWPF